MRAVARRLRVLIAIALALAAVLVYQVFIAAPEVRGDPLAFAECPFRGEPRVTVTSRVTPEDTFPVRAHEAVHAEQCRKIGPWRFRLRNLTGRGRLSVEAPAYCAGARARLKQGSDPIIVRERLLDDAQAAFRGLADSTAVRNALRRSCPDIV